MVQYSAASPLQIAVVGHTNTGKTSLLRTLLQDTDFGEVSSRPSTTRDVSAAHLLLKGEAVIALYDTPGLEDGLGLFAELERIQESKFRHDGPAQIQAFLATELAQSEFEQEAKVLKQLLHSDAALYLIDARDPVLPKYQDELDILRRCGKPILPILNFTASTESQAPAWMDALARVNLHGWVEFDTVSLPAYGEKPLFEHLSTLLPSARELLRTILAEREQRRAHKDQAAKRLVAELLLDVAAFTVTVKEKSQHETAVNTMQAAVKAREQECLERLLELYSFQKTVVNLPEVAVSAGEWESDLFSPETFKAFGIKAGKGIAAGGAAGASVDLLFGGMTLGAGTVIGAAAGGAWQTWQKYGRNLKHKVQGYYDIQIDEAVIRLLAARQQELILALNKRGHAAVEPLRLLNREQKLASPDRFKRFLLMARDNPDWSSINSRYFEDSSAREACINLLV
ncbi:DUF3482 domain-containing protein [Aliidiomarina iranensis]|uniref:DUF3482 domain-containing protein n=1 Tax=Aliidiomarina iranensis TaxID=1434071 RepID=A0A432VZW4_9GAMM|nr:GTPase/DUF3482 domain-containing protein [Aliidiomarina iranensis]RUO22278.1 DUF3482 domain-containing protein [Aliidiomarina iranensis]